MVWHCIGIHCHCCTTLQDKIHFWLTVKMGLKCIRLANLCNSSLVLLGNLLDNGVVKDTWVIILLHRTSGIAQWRVGLKHDACSECMQTTSNQKTSTEFITTTTGKQWDVLHPQHDHTSEGNIYPPLLYTTLKPPQLCYIPCATEAVETVSVE